MKAQKKHFGLTGFLNLLPCIPQSLIFSRIQGINDSTLKIAGYDTFDMFDVFIPCVYGWISNTTSFRAKRHNAKEIPWLGVVMIGRFLLVFDDVSHVQGATRVTLRTKSKLDSQQMKLTPHVSFPSSPPAHIWSDCGMKSKSFLRH